MASSWQLTAGLREYNYLSFFLSPGASGGGQIRTLDLEMVWTVF